MHHVVEHLSMHGLYTLALRFDDSSEPRVGLGLGARAWRARCVGPLQDNGSLNRVGWTQH